MQEFGYADISHLARFNGRVYGLMRSNLFQSTDGGQSWTKLRGLPYQVEAMALIGESLWFVGCEGSCAAYDLRKGTLQHFPLPTQRGVYSIAGKEQTLIAVGGHGSIFVSSVNPPVWKKVNTGRTDTLRDVAFAADGTAFVVGGDYEDLFTGWANRVALKSREYVEWEDVDLP